MTVNYTAYLTQAYEQHKEQEELEYQKLVVAVREFYDGHMTPDLQRELTLALLSQDAIDIQNLFDVYGTRIDERASRLTISHLSEIPFMIHANAPEAPPLEWAMDLWEEAGMDALQHDLWVKTLRDKETFVLLSPELQPDNTMRIVPRIHLRYTSAESGGDNRGMKIHYPDNDDSRPPSFITKRWVESYKDNKGYVRQRQRMNLYRYPELDRKTKKQIPISIEKWVWDDRKWIKYRDDEDEAWPIEWVNPTTGEPLPMPIIHFTNVLDRMEGKKMMGPQVIIDNIVTAITSTASSVAIPGLIAIGTQPTDDGLPPKEDGSNVWTWGPNQVISVPNKRPQDASVNPTKPGDVSQLIEALKQIITLASITTGTPSLIADQVGRQQVSGEALRQIDIRPTSDVRQMQIRFGAKIHEMMQTWAKIHNAFGGTLDIPTDTKHVYAHWLPADVRDFDTVADPGEKSEINAATEESRTIPNMQPKTLE